MAYEGTCMECILFDNSSPCKEGKYFGVCGDKLNLRRYNSVVNGKERRTCFKTQMDLLRDRDKTKQVKLF